MLRPNWEDRDGRGPNQRYEVIVGHARVQVTGASDAEAVEAARRRLCLDMPRMWDVIQTLDVQRFEVKRLS